MRARIVVVVALAAVGVLSTALAATASVAGMSPVVSTKLSSRNEVPKKSPMGSGLAVVHLDSSKGTVCWTFTNVTGIGKPTAAHIHKGAAGKAGPVVVPLGAAYKAKGCVKAPGALIGTIEEHPSAYYVNVHTAKYPAGAIRGSLVAGMHG